MPIRIGKQSPRDFGVVTSLPTSEAVKGDRCTYKAATGVYWDLLYTGEETYPWAKIGGPPLRSTPANLENKTNTTESTTGAPSLTAPLAMEFGGSFGAKWVQLAEGSSPTMLLRIRVNGVAKLELAVISNFIFATTPMMTSIVAPLTVAAGQAIGLGYALSTTGKMTFAGAFLDVDPIRVA